MTTTTASFYVSTATTRKETAIRVSFWVAGHDGVHQNAHLTPADALKLAKDLMRTVDALPRVASEADLGIAA